MKNGLIIQRKKVRQESGKLWHISVLVLMEEKVDKKYMEGKK